MILKIINPEGIVTKERFECNIEIWRKWYLEMRDRWARASKLKTHRNLFDVDECQELGYISWIHIFAILKWLDEQKIMCLVDYKAGKKITIQ